LVQLYLPLVEMLAQRHDRRSADHDDLVQAGSIGLLNAIERFDPTRGDEFAAFAVPTIAGEIKRHLRDRTSTVRLPRRLHEVSVRLPEARQELTARLGRAPSPSELAEVLGVTADELARLENRTNGMIDDRAPDSAASELDATESRLLLADAFRSLDETERTIIYLRFVRERSRREAAEELKMSPSALARRTAVALSKLRGELEDRAFEQGSSSPPTLVAEAPPEPARRPGPGLRPTQGRETGADEPAPVSGAKARAGHSGRLMLRMPQSLHAELAQAAEREEVSLNQFITNTLSASLRWHSDSQETRTPPQWMRAAIVTNIVVVVIAGAIALVLLIIAWQQGW
jgi:RNA polymerase sigma-B factor